MAPWHSPEKGAGILTDYMGCKKNLKTNIDMDDSSLIRPDNTTCQLPISSQRKVKLGWERQEREKRWWRIGVCKKYMSK